MPALSNGHHRLQAPHLYPPESAGRLLTPHVPRVYREQTIGDIQDLLIKTAKQFDAIEYTYILSPIQRLVGVISIREIFKQPQSTLVETVMTQKVISAHPYTDQEHLVFLALEHGIKAIPIVDKDDHFLGVVTSDNILKITQQEAHEDLFRISGLHPQASMFDDIFRLSIGKSLRHRLPWLLLGLVGGILTAQLIKSFESTLEQNLILAAYIPLIVYMADAVGTQMEAFIIRDLAVKPNLHFFSYLGRQLSIVVIIGLISSSLLFVINSLHNQSPYVGLVLTLSLLMAIISSVFTGLLIPYLFRLIKLDPANASGPVATIIQDITSIFIYFSLARWLL